MRKARASTADRAPICLQRCSAPCVDRIDPEGYAELVRDAQDFLGGKSTKVQQKLGTAMQAASDAMDFEQAAGGVKQGKGATCGRGHHRQRG